MTFERWLTLEIYYSECRLHSRRVSFEDLAREQARREVLEEVLRELHNLTEKP